MRFVLEKWDVGILAILLFLFAFFSLTTQRFLSVGNLLDILRQASLLAILAVGVTYLMIAGEFDLSVGSNYGLLATLVGFLVVNRHVNPWLAGLIVIALGMIVGLLNGLLVTGLGLSSFIVTFGSMISLRGVTDLVSGGFPISATDLNSGFYGLLEGSFFRGVPNLVILMVVITGIAGVVLATTRFGCDVYAVGGNVNAARNCGINARSIKLACFVMTGGLCGVIAAFLFGWIGVAPYNTGSGYELRAIAAAVLGGTGLFGGRGTVFGSVMGCILLGMLTDGLIMMGVRQFWDGVAAGSIILLAAAMDLVLRQKTAARSA
jgi:ribose transport system permease protein